MTITAKHHFPREKGGRRLLLEALEINAVSRCNLSCVGCSRSSPAAATAFSDPEEVARDLGLLARAAVCKTLRITGGEPLLHPRLPALLRAVRASGITSRVEVITNGTLLGRVPWAWLTYADKVQVSSYPSRPAGGAGLEELRRRCAGAGKGLEVRDYHSFRLYRAAAGLTKPAAARVFRACQDAHASSCHPVSGGAVYLCLPSLAAGAGGDSVCRLEPARTLRARLERFLLRKTPLAGCAACLGTSGNKVPHAQAAPADWERLSARGRLDERRLRRVLSEPCLEQDLCAPRFALEGKAAADAFGRGGMDWKRFFSARRAARPRKAAPPPPPPPGSGSRRAPPALAAALRLQAAGDDKAALGVLDAAVRAGGAPPEVYNARGVALRFLGRPRQAARDFKTALRLEPGFMDARRNLLALRPARAASTRRRAKGVF